MRKKGRTRIVVLLALGALGVGLLRIGPAGATHNRYSVDAVTISVDRSARLLKGTVIADSVDSHFCTSDGDWPVKIKLVRPGRDKTVADANWNFDGTRWKARPPRTVKGKRVYALVPSYPNNAHGYCVGARSRIVRAP